MQFSVIHELDNRMRVQLAVRHLCIKQADTLQYYLECIDGIDSVSIYERAGSVAIAYNSQLLDRADLIYALRLFSFDNTDVPSEYLDNSSRELDLYYKEKILSRVIKRFTVKTIMPTFLRGIFIYKRVARFVHAGLRSLLSGHLRVEVLDATAVSVAMLQGNSQGAGSIMFLLDIGELLEEWTHKRTVRDLARSMSLSTTTVWKVEDNTEYQVSSDTVLVGDTIKVYMGTTIPFDGIVVAGEASVNESSLTGEPVAKFKHESSVVYAGSVVEDGEVVFEVTQTASESRYEQIVAMIEETEALKSNVESSANHLADRLVPYSLATSALVYLLSGNAIKATSVLMVDYSCALKLSMPITVLACIREARSLGISIKGGKFIEKIAEADTIVLDKTGTLTYADSKLHGVVSFTDASEDDLLRAAACLEEHFPHSIANAVVNAAETRNLKHEELHSDVEYVVAHGIVSSIDNNRIVIGSAHFVFDDEKCVVPADKQDLFDSLPEQYSRLYMAFDGTLIAVLLIEDPLRLEASETILKLKSLGINNVVMMTGDSEKTAKYIASEVGVDSYFSEVLPQDKADFVIKQKEAGHTVLMVGDDINDSPALSASDCGIAISDGSELARDIADVTIDANSLESLVTLKKLSNLMMDRIHSNYHNIIWINSLLIGAGILGVTQPYVNALIHNTSTIGISIASTKPLLSEAN